MQISLSEFRAHIGKYLTLAANQDICITKYGKRVVRLTAIKSQADMGAADNRVGFLGEEVTVSEDFDSMGREEIRALFEDS